MGKYWTLLFKEGHCLVVCLYLFRLYLYIILHLLNFLRKCWLNAIELLKNQWYFWHFIYQEQVSKHLVRDRNNSAKIDFWLMFMYRKFLSNPLPNFPKPMNPICLFKRRRLFFSHCLIWLFSFYWFNYPATNIIVKITVASIY